MSKFNCLFVEFTVINCIHSFIDLLRNQAMVPRRKDTDNCSRLLFFLSFIMRMRVHILPEALNSRSPLDDVPTRKYQIRRQKRVKSHYVQLVEYMQDFRD